MKAIKLFDWVIKEHQRSILVDAVPEKREYVLSNDFFNQLQVSALENGYAEVTSTVVKVVENHDIPNAWKVLGQNVKDGFWVYSFTCSMDYHEFRWCSNEKEALEAYNTIEVAYFVCQKYLIHTEKGVLMKQNINGG